MSIQVIHAQNVSDGDLLRDWERILAERDSYSFFHAPQWADLLHSVLPQGRMKHLFLRFSDGNEAVLPLLALPRKFMFYKIESLPWGTYGGLISSSTMTEHHYRAISRLVLSWREPIAILTLPPGERIEEDSSLQFHGQSLTTHILPLQNGFDEIWNTRFQSRLRTSIRKAQREGVTISGSSDKHAIQELKRLYLKACEAWQNIETLPMHFFEALETLPETGFKIWIAECRGEAIATDLLFYGKGDVQYFAGASAREFSALQAPKLLMSEIIQDACHRGYLSLNFGASGGLSGVEQFKRLFGAEPVQYRRIRLTHPLLGCRR